MSKRSRKNITNRNGNNAIDARRNKINMERFRKLIKKWNKEKPKAKKGCPTCGIMGGYRGGGEFDMDMDEQTGSSTGNMQKSLKSQDYRNQAGGSSFIPAPGVPSNGVRGMSFLANNSTQGVADAEMDKNVHNLEKPCTRGGRKRRRTKKRKSKRRRKRTKKRKSRKKTRRRKRRRNRPIVRFSKMPPLYL